MTARQQAFIQAAKFDIPPCDHCGRCVLAGPPCCQGMIDDIKRKQEEERENRYRIKRARAVARRAARRAALKGGPKIP